MSLTRMIKKIKKDRNELKILFVGLDNAGKTTIIHKLFQKHTAEISPTFGYQIHSLKYTIDANKKEKRIVNLTLLDVGGQTSFRKYWSNYYEKLDGMVFVFDLTDPRGFNEFLNKAMDEIEDKNIPFLILANKNDLMVQKEDHENIKIDFLNIHSEKIKLFECSGWTGENLKESFEWFIKKILVNDIKI